MNYYSWSAINKFGVQIIGFVANVLIARELTPDDYGLIAMLAIFIGIAWNFTESGFADWLIRDANADKKDFSTIFVHNVVFGILFYFILYCVAPLISNFYQKPELVEITRILGLSIIFKSISITEFTRMRKELLFKNIAVIQITSNLLAFFIAYYLAISGWGYWALVVQAISIGFFSLLMIVVLNKWKPVFYFSWSRYKVMRKFGNNMLISYFTNQLGDNLYSVFIGKFHSSATLGYYNQGVKINKVGFNSVNSIVLTTSYSLLSKETDLVKRKKMYINIMNHFLFIHFFMTFSIIGSAYLILELLFGNQWLPTAPLLQLLLVSFLFQPLISLNANIVKVENKPQIYRNLTFLRNGLILLALFITYKYSIVTIILGQVVARYISAFFYIVTCGKYISFFPYEQLKIIFSQIIAPLLSFALAYSIYESFTSFLLLRLMVFIVVFLLVFIIVNVLIKNTSFTFYLNKLRVVLKL
ncbi:lipopolysaccharide biosynthesis protein [Pontimicrobium sp. IMCC45349]|uniref:lipopolysaccharide biosynthesis protein n=1 Tax=Pontimicrobium sp. IMCC45349 TaxID=3391574 RepID=UPI0039A18143